MSKKDLLCTNEMKGFLYSLTPDQMVTLHLLYSVFLQTQQEKGIIEASLPAVKDYLRKAKYAIGDFVKNANEHKALDDLLTANRSLYEELPKVFEDPSEEHEKLLETFAYNFRKIATNCSEILGAQTFKRCFPDVFKTKEGYCNSPKATIIVHGFMKQMDKDLGIKPKASSDSTDSFDMPTDKLDKKKENKPTQTKSKTKTSPRPKKEKMPDISKISSIVETENGFVVTFDDGLHPYYENWESLKPVLVTIPYEKALLFHAITLLLCKKFLKWEWFTKYQKSVTKAFTAYKGNSIPQQKKMALNYANGAFDQLKESVLDYILKGHDYRAVALKNDLFTLATDLCLKDINASISSDNAEELLKDVRVFKDGISVSHELEGYAFSLYLSANQEYIDLYGKKIEDLHLSDDWTDFEEDDDEWLNKRYGFYRDYEEEYVDEDEEEESFREPTEYEKKKAESEKQITDYIDRVSEILQKSDNDRDLVLHLVNMKMMARVAKPSAYSKYLRAVRALVSEFNGKSDITNVSEARNKADELFLSRYKTFLKDSSYSVNKGKIVEYWLLSEAFATSFVQVMRLPKETISQIIDSLTYNGVINEYESSRIKELALEILDKAREEILAGEDEGAE